MITTETLFWTQIASIIVFIVTLFALYRLLVDQKDATIQLQKENIAYLKDQLTEAKTQSPDVLALSLSMRVKMFEDELKRLNEDKSSTETQVKAKEAELHQARSEAEDLTKKVVHARELLKEFLCPQCESPLAEKTFGWESVEYDGREIDVDHEYAAFECGYAIADGKEVKPCGSVKKLNKP